MCKIDARHWDNDWKGIVFCLILFLWIAIASAAWWVRSIYTNRRVNRLKCLFIESVAIWQQDVLGCKRKPGYILLLQRNEAMKHTWAMYSGHETTNLILKKSYSENILQVDCNGKWSRKRFDAIQWEGQFKTIPSCFIYYARNQVKHLIFPKSLTLWVFADVLI